MSSAPGDGWEDDDDVGGSEVEGRRKMERSNTGSSSFSNAIRRLSVSVKSRNNTTPSSPVLQSRSGSHNRRESAGSR